MSEHQPLHLKKKPAAGGNTDEKPSPHLGARTLGLRGGDKRGGGGGPSELLRTAVEKMAMARSSGMSSRATASAFPDRMNSPSPNPSSMSPSPSPMSPFNPLSPANAASPALYDLNPAPLPASVAQLQPLSQPAQVNNHLYLSMSQQPVSVQPVPAVTGALSALAALTSDSGGPRKPFTRPEAIDSDDKEKEGADSQKSSGEDTVSRVELYPSPSPQPSREEVLRQEVLSSTGRVRDLVMSLDLSRGSTVVPVLELVKNNLNQCVWVLEQEQDEPAPRGLPVPFSVMGEAARRSSSKHLDIVKQLQEVEASEVRANAHLVEEQPVVDKAPFLKSLSRQDLNQHTVTRDYDSPRLGARSIKDSPLVARRSRPDAPAPVGGPPTSSRAMHQKRMEPVASAVAVAAALREEEAIEQKLPPQRDVMSERPPNPLRSPHQHSVDSDTDNDSDEESQHAETITVHARTPVPGPRAAQSDLLPLRRAEIEAANALASTSAAARNSARMSRIFNASASLLDNEKSSVNAESTAAEGLDRSALPKINAIGSGVTEDYNSPDISSRRLRSRQLNREREAMAARDAKNPQPSARAAAVGGVTSSRAVTSHSAAQPPVQQQSIQQQQQQQQQVAAQPEVVNLRGSVEGLGLDRDAVVLSVKESPFLSMDRLRDRLLRDGDLAYAGKKQRKTGDQDVDSVVAAAAAVPAPVAPSGLAVAVRRPSERIDVGVTDSPPSSPKEFAALRLRSFAKEDLELQDQQAAKAREETPRPTFLRRIDLSVENEAGAPPVIPDPTAEKDRRQIVELLDRISKLTTSLHHLTPQSLEQVRVLLQLSLQKVETVSAATNN